MMVTNETNLEELTRIQRSRQATASSTKESVCGHQNQTDVSKIFECKRILQDPCENKFVRGPNIQRKFTHRTSKSTEKDEESELKLSRAGFPYKNADQLLPSSKRKFATPKLFLSCKGLKKSLSLNRPAATILIS
jgi:hypothetical protein